MKRDKSIISKILETKEDIENKSLPELVADTLKTESQSKYDFVKVRVWIGQHSYVLSRYILCRSLVGTKMELKHAIQVSLELKKTLVDLGLTDIVQEQFEDYLYKIMGLYGYTETHVQRYRMLSKFHRKRIPLLILISGIGCVGKSTLATQLATRMNLSNVLQTDMVVELMQCFGELQQYKQKLDISSFPSPQHFLERYQMEAKIARKGIHGDISKCLNDGKSTIIEGLHVDPSLYQTQYPNAIVIPILLTMQPIHHSTFTKISPSIQKYTQTQRDLLHENYTTLQNHLVATAQNFHILNYNIYSFHDTLNQVHDIILHTIETHSEVIK